MRTMDDRDLLAAYVRDRSEAAFGELVRRHLGWVYSVALRHLGNPALAEEVAQSVFVLLARKAGSLRSGSTPGGWLFRTTRFVANRALRAERRRRTREETAASMIPLTTSSDENEAVWKELEPYLEQAVASLSETDREAILLRFYQEKPLLEVGVCLGLSEEAAKKRVSRAIQKMREFLAGHGVAVGGTVLAGLMAEQTVQAVPAGLVASVAKVAAASISSSGALPQLAQEVLNAWRRTRFKITAGVTASLCGLAWLGFALTQHSPAIDNSPGKLESVQAPAEQPRKTIGVSPESQADPATKPKARAIHFRVLAKDTDEPVSFAPLAVNSVSDEGWKRRFDLATDEKGSADIPYPPAATRLDVGVIASGWVARFATFRTDSDPEIPADYTLNVDRMTNSMGGWLRNEEGQPVANAVVEMEFSVSDMAREENPRERPGFVSSAPIARSDRNGWWTCAVVDPNAERIPRLLARHPDFAPTTIVPASLGDPEDPRSESVKLLRSGRSITTMARGVTLTGRIMSEEGRPVGGAQIEQEPSSFDSLHAEADSLGRFAVPGLPPGEFDFIVTAPGFEQTYTNVNVREGMGPVAVRLQPGGVLRLQLVDEAENAVVNGRVVLTGTAGIHSRAMNWSAQSGPNGKVEWTSAPTNTILNICAYKSPEFAMSCTLAQADGEEKIIRLRRTFVVTGRVTDDRTGELIQTEINVFPGYGQGEYSWFRGETRRSADGTFRVCFGEGRSPRRFRIEAEGYAPFESDWLQPDASSVVDVRLRPTDPSKTVGGTVWRTDGRPAQGAQVALLSPEHSVFLGRARFIRRAAVDRLIITADENGKFVFPEEPNPSFVVAACSNGFARVQVGDLKAPMEIHLQPWGRIEASMDASAGNRPVDCVIVDNLLAMNAPGCVRLDSQEFHAKPTEDGQFVLEFVPQGLLCVWLSSGHTQTPLTPAYHHPTWVQVRAGETSRARIAETGCHVKGRFVLNGGEGNVINQPAYAILEDDWASESGNSAGPNAKQWMRVFFDLGRLIIAPDGKFESRDAINPGIYRLLGKIGDVSIDQPVGVPDGQRIDFLNSGYLDNDPPVIDLGDILVVPKERTGAKQQ